MWGATDITVRFGQQVALDRIALALEPGEVTAIVGGDGAGKTTLLRTLMRRIAPIGGTIEMPPVASIGYQPATSGVWRALTVDENIAFVGRAYGMTGEELVQRRQEILTRTGLAQAADRLGNQLSGGMRQKLGFGLALLHQPSLLLLDEPTTGVDPVSRVELWRMIAEAAAAGAAVAMATTYLDEAERATCVLILNDGKALGTGTPDGIVSSIPGYVTASSTRPSGTQGFTWRRGSALHTWHPDREPPGDHLTIDLEDAVIALTLNQESAGGSSPVPEVTHA